MPASRFCNRLTFAYLQSPASPMPDVGPVITIVWPFNLLSRKFILPLLRKIKFEIKDDPL